MTLDEYMALMEFCESRIEARAAISVDDAARYWLRCVRNPCHEKEYMLSSVLPLQVPRPVLRHGAVSVPPALPALHQVRCVFASEQRCYERISRAIRGW